MRSYSLTPVCFIAVAVSVAFGTGLRRRLRREATSDRGLSGCLWWVHLPARRVGRPVVAGGGVAEGLTVPPPAPRTPPIASFVSLRILSF